MQIKGFFKNILLRKIVGKGIKVLFWMLSIFLSVFFLLALTLQFPPVQEYAKTKALTYFEGKIQTKVSIDRIGIGFPKRIVIKGVFIEDQKKDTLLFGEKLVVDIDLFKLFRNKIEINSVNLIGIVSDINRDENGIFNFDYIINAFSPNEKSSGSTSLQFTIERIRLERINFKYSDAVTKNHIEVYLHYFNTNIKTFDLKKQLIYISKVDLSDAKGIMVLGRNTNKNSNDFLENETSNSWKIKIDKIGVENVDFRFDDENSIPVGKGIDFGHLDFYGLNLKISQFYYSPETISSNIRLLQIKEQSGFELLSFSTGFHFGPTGAWLKQLHFKTLHSELKNDILISYPSLKVIKADLGELIIDAKFTNCQIGFRDILFFAPSMDSLVLFKNLSESTLVLNSSFSGKLKKLEIPYFELSGIGSTKLSLSGNIKGLPHLDNSFFDLNINEFESSFEDIQNILPPNTIPKTIQLPPKFKVKGAVKGTIANFSTNIKLNSSFGAAQLNASLDQTIKNQEKYELQVGLDSFSLGKVIKNDSLGTITLRTNIKGVGLKPKTASAELRGTLIEAVYNSYHYHNFNFEGKISNDIFHVSADINDPNLSFDLLAKGSIKEGMPSGKLKLNITLADLHKLHFTSNPLRIKGILDADKQVSDVDYLNGKVYLHNLVITNANDHFFVDSIQIIAASKGGINRLYLYSEFADAEIVGKFKFTKVTAAVSNSIRKYFNADTGSYKEISEQQQFTLNFNMKNNLVLEKLIPQLESLGPTSFHARYNSVNDSIIVNGMIPRLIYGKTKVINAALAINKHEGALVYSFNVDDIQNGKLQLHHTSILGMVKDNTVEYALKLKDAQNTERYFISGKVAVSDGVTEITLDPKKLLLNYENWLIASDNLIRIGKQGVYVRNLDLSNEANRLRVQSQSIDSNAPLEIYFDNFEIETITNMTQNSDLNLTGQINGSALLKNISTTPVFTSGLIISDFAFKNDTIGNISLKVNNEVDSIYMADIIVTSHNNQADIKGYYNATNGSFDMKLKIKHIDLNSIQGFTMNNITESIGYITGDFSIKGNSKDPKIIGTLKFHDAGFKVVPLNTTFKSINDKISLSGDVVVFDNFSITDENNNKLAVDGKIFMANFAEPRFDLAINADNFKAINSKSDGNNQYYGELFLSSRLRIKGDLNNLIVDGKLNVNKDTRFTVELPQPDPSIADREGVVEFIDSSNIQLYETNVINDSIGVTNIKGITVSVNIEIDKEAGLTIIIDKANGDYLKLKGEALLSGGIDPSGKATLTGRYEFTEGTYEMNFNLIKKKFNIKKGSYILWTGEPTSANVSITAVYKTEAAPIDLVGNQLGTISEGARNLYRQRIPFETELIMSGELLKPNISFNILLPEGNNNVSTEVINTVQFKLEQLRQQPSELNKQVFALLLFNRFIGENILSGQSSGIIASTLARQSAGKIMSQQLNNLAGDLIKGVELKFDIDASEDYSTGQYESQTDLNVGVSKKLFDDRFKITVGSSFGLEGPQHENQKATNIAGDISTEYKLSKDGRYRMRAYRKNMYQVALLGEVVETGLVFIITLDYDKFKDIYLAGHKSKYIKKSDE